MADTHRNLPLDHVPALRKNMKYIEVIMQMERDVPPSPCQAPECEYPHLHHVLIENFVHGISRQKPLLYLHPFPPSISDCI
jgi:hypothetical protein